MGICEQLLRAVETAKKSTEKRKKKQRSVRSCLKGPLFPESLTRRAGWESQQDQAARAEKKKIFDALALASILHNSALESANKVAFSPF
jgi:hypothetical protein